MLEPGLPVWPLWPPHRAMSQGEVVSRPVRTRGQDREPWRSEETHVVSPNTNAVGNWEESKPSPGSREILLDRENSRPGRTAQTKGNARERNRERENRRNVVRTSNVQSHGGDGQGKRSTGGRRWERTGPCVHCSIPFSPRSSGGGGRTMASLPPGRRSGLWGLTSQITGLSGHSAHPDGTDPDLSSLHPTAPGLTWCGGNFQNVLPLAESSIQGKNGREEL